MTGSGCPHPADARIIADDDVSCGVCFNPVDIEQLAVQALADAVGDSITVGSG